MISKVKKLAISLSLVIGASSVPINSANAFVNIDYAQLGTKIYESMADYYKQAESMDLMGAIMDQAASFVSLKIDGQNTAWSNVIVRQNDALQAIQNLVVVEWSMAAINPEITSFGALLDDCNTDEKILEEQAKDRKIISDEEALLGVEGETIKSIQDDIVARFSAQNNICNILSKEESKNNKETGKTKSAYDTISTEDNEQTLNANPVLASNLIGTMTTSDTLSKSQINAVKDYVFLIAPPYVPSSNKINISDLSTAEQIFIAEEEVYRGYPRRVLQSIGFKKHPSEIHGLSEIEILSWYAKEHIFSGDESLNSITGKIMNSSVATPSVVWKNMALLRAFQVHMALEKYKQSLVSEVTSSIALAHKVRKTNNKK